MSKQKSERSVRVLVLIPAGGQGLRFGCRKQFVKVGGQLLFLRTVRRLREILAARGWVSDIAVAVPEDDVGQAAELSVAAGEGAILAVSGGETRHESVCRAYREAMRYFPCASDGGYDFVLVHDACRPLVRKEMVERLFHALSEGGAEFALPALPVTDTLKRKDSMENIPREECVTVQTPQVMTSAVARDLYMAERTPRDPMITDDSTLARTLGHSIVAVAGDRRNIKITEPEDVFLLEAMLQISE